MTVLGDPIAHPGRVGASYWPLDLVAGGVVDAHHAACSAAAVIALTLFSLVLRVRVAPVWHQGCGASIREGRSRRGGGGRTALQIGRRGSTCTRRIGEGIGDCGAEQRVGDLEQ